MGCADKFDHICQYRMDKQRHSVATLFGQDISASTFTSRLTDKEILLGNREDNSRRIFLLSERCNGLLKSRLFADCIPLLEQLLLVEQNPWFKLKTQLKITECAIRCNLRQRAETEMAITRKVSLGLPNIDFHDLVTIAEEYKHQKSYIDALVLYICAVEALIVAGDLRNNINNIAECFVMVRNMAQSLKTSLDEAKSLTSMISADCLIEILEQLRQSDQFLEPCMEAICMNNIAIVLSISGKLRDAESYFFRALKIMEDEYPQNSSKYLVYGNLLSNLGRVSLSFGYLTEAKTYFMRSIMAWNLAENFPNESQRATQISATMQRVDYIDMQLTGK